MFQRRMLTPILCVAIVPASFSQHAQTDPFSSLSAAEESSLRSSAIGGSGEGKWMYLVKVLLKHAFLFYISAALALAVFMGFATDVRHQYQLANEGVRTHGVIVEPICQRHSSFSYRFEAEGTTYSGLSISYQCGEIKSGSAVFVHYLPGNPKVSTATDPSFALRNNLATILMATLTGPAILLLFFRLKLKMWTKENLASTSR